MIMLPREDDGTWQRAFDNACVFIRLARVRAQQTETPEKVDIIYAALVSQCEPRQQKGTNNDV